MTKTYHFKTKVFVHPGKAAWYFTTLPVDIAKEINYFFSHAKRGWGSLRVSVQVGATTWETSIFPDKKSSSFMLPLKVAVREKEGMTLVKRVTFIIRLSD